MGNASTALQSSSGTDQGACKLIRRIAATAAIAVGLMAALAGPGAISANAASSDCHAWVTSSGRPGGGVTGVCNGISNWVQVVGLCQNIFTRSSRFVDGNWVHAGPSFAPCRWYEAPVGGYVRIGSS